MLDKTYRPETVEGRQYERWEAAGAFRADPAAGGEPYAIMIPPPNVTGSLHIGHAFNNTIQDILIRFHRMQGRNVLWQPGTDHAGIATQMVVERMLAEQGIALDRGIPPKDGETETICREAFIEKVWAWREESGGTILKQLRRLGATCDWARERFTMDEGLSRAVLRVFVQLYKDGLIYRDKRLVNWDPKFHTAISDLEVEQREIDGHLWHIRYPIEGEEGRHIVVATTRPETMLGDTAVAVHPEDDRYRDLVGRHAVLPLVGRRLRIVADNYADPEQGSGAVKITPAHDFNDFEVGQRHGLEMVNILDADARIKDSAPDAYCGLDRFEARRRIVADLQAQGLLERIEDHRHSVPHGDRSGVPLEPYLTDQWFADAATLAKPCIEAVEDGRTTFVPEQFSRVYFQWMRNIQPWCISRQLWWGHQVPVWYGPDGAIFVEETEAEALAAANAHYGEPATLTRDTDVLDTWFSSALWPFSTLGWPDETPELARYYPGSVLVTGEDIIFFWVARMMMMGMHFMRDGEGAGRVPFADVYIHGLVRDARGQKYSKSKGNVVDPVDLMDKYGADALRFTLASLAVQGRDIKLAESRIAGYRNFATKIWNAARFCELNEASYGPDFDPANNANRVNRWIVSQLAQLEPRVRAAIEGYRFNEAAHEFYQFVWHSYCDWYLEFAKPLMQSDDSAVLAETRATALWTLHKALAMMHPFMPFLTEELWEQTGPGSKQEDGGLLIAADWPAIDGGLIDGAADAELGWLVEIISRIRAVRGEMNVPPGARIPLILKGASAGTRNRIAAHRALIDRLARLSDIRFGDAVPAGSIQDVVGEATIVLPLADVIDLDQEKARLRKEIGRADGEIAKIDKKLSNRGFIAKAPSEVVEENRERREEAEQARAKLAEALKRLEAA
ncbi:MAG: valine--tRNA ligase [Rhodospirillaceae bacterium]|nr:valine--tRNA ligase [Rhodospirillaceae bacterium]